MYLNEKLQFFAIRERLMIFKDPYISMWMINSDCRPAMLSFGGVLLRYDETIAMFI